MTGGARSRRNDRSRKRAEHSADHCRGVKSGRATGTDLPIVPTIKVGEMEIDIFHRRVRDGDSVVHLSGIEQSLLYLLASRGGRVVTRDDILDAIWGSDFVAPRQERQGRRQTHSPVRRRDYGR